MLCGSRLVSPREILSGRIGVIHATPAVRQCSDLPPPGAQHRGGLFRREEDPFASPCLAQFEILGHRGRVTEGWMRHGGYFGGAERSPVAAGCEDPPLVRRDASANPREVV